MFSTATNSRRFTAPRSTGLRIPAAARWRSCRAKEDQNSAASAEAKRGSRDCSRFRSAAAASARKASKSIATAAVSCDTSADVDGRAITTSTAAKKVRTAAVARIRTDMVKLPARPLPPKPRYKGQALKPRETACPAWTQHVSQILTRGRRRKPPVGIDILGLFRRDDQRVARVGRKAFSLRQAKLLTHDVGPEHHRHDLVISVPAAHAFAAHAAVRGQNQSLG